MLNELVSAQQCEHDDPGAAGFLTQGLREAEECRRLLVTEGFAKCPTWLDIADRQAPPNPEVEDREPGEWCHGWQFFASRTREIRFLEFEIKNQLDPCSQALLLSHSGAHAARFLQAIPHAPEFQLSGPVLQCLLRRRLRLPLPDGLAHCPAKSHGKITARLALDEFGDHLAACMHTGRVQRRANVLEKAWAQVFREAGGLIVLNEKLRNMRIGVQPEDRRRVEFAVYNLPFSGIPLLCDVTQVSPISSNGNPHPKTCTCPGISLEKAESKKHKNYREAAERRGDVKLVTLACEVGGRWSETCIHWVRRLAIHKASQQPMHLQKATEYAFSARWWSLLSVAAQRAFAFSLLDVDVGQLKPTASFTPGTGEVLAGARYELGPVVSRLPLRVS